MVVFGVRCTPKHIHNIEIKTACGSWLCLVCVGVPKRCGCRMWCFVWCGLSIFSDVNVLLCDFG